MDLSHMILLALRLPISVLLVAFLPGYSLGYWLFLRGALDWVERIFLAIVASVAISSLVGFALLRFHGLLEPSSFSVAIASVTLLFSLGALWRAKHNRATDGSPEPDHSLFRVQPSIHHRYRPLPILACVPVLAIAIALLPSLAKNTEPPITEFFISPQYLDIVQSPEPQRDLSEIPVVILNHEGQAQTYRIEVWANDEYKIWELPELSVPEGATRQQSIPILLSESSDVSFLDFDLYVKGEQQPVANLRLWLAGNNGR